ncbi:hypothetical protein AB0M20_45310, partial [Actinoplanes sp. NPDC051633]|uniref:hypothetical protein n=1 Tax=Actinoplanes sp. NPDC051633 TaxID=3155670 RepID=UPI00344113E1
RKDPAQFVDGAPVAASAAPEVAVKPVPEKTTTGKAEIAKNPDGTVNSANAKPVTTGSTLSAGGLGPYKIGTTLKALQSAKLVGRTEKLRADNCPDHVAATGTSKFHSPELVFFDGRLLRLTVTGDKITTSRGVKIGSTVATVKAKYADGKQIDDSVGRGAWLSTIGDYGLLFELNGDKVSGLQAGMAEPMQFKYTDNQGC